MPARDDRYYRVSITIGLPIDFHYEKVLIVIDSDLKNFIPLNHVFFLRFLKFSIIFSIFSSKMIYFFQYFSNVNMCVHKYDLG